MSESNNVSMDKAKNAIAKTNGASNGSTSEIARAILEKVEPEIIKALPKYVDKDRFLRVCLTYIRLNPKIMECDPMSLMGALVTSAQYGLEPGILDHCYLIPYKGQVQFQIGYKGIIDLARRSGGLVSIHAQVFYQQEIDSGRFLHTEGTDLNVYHQPMIELMGDKDIAGAYAVAKLNGGDVQIAVMGKSQIDELRNTFSPSAKFGSSPWDGSYLEMCKKTVVKRLFKLFPISLEIAEVISRDENIVNKSGELVSILNDGKKGDKNE